MAKTKAIPNGGGENNSRILLKEKDPTLLNSCLRLDCPGLTLEDLRYDHQGDLARR